MKDYKAGIYLRLSKEDNNPNNSIDAQREITLNYARKNNFDVIKEYADNGWSGILESRPALNEMIIDILHKKINMLIVKDLSRLGRNYLDSGYYIEKYFPEHRIRFIAVNDSLDSNDGENDFGPFKNIINENLT